VLDGGIGGGGNIIIDVVSNVSIDLIRWINVMKGAYAGLHLPHGEATGNKGSAVSCAGFASMFSAIKG